MTIAVTSPGLSASRAWLRASICAIYATFLLAPHLAGYLTHGDIRLEDDAYFYLVIARNIVETGRSTFDLQTLTNGYHPLWQLVMVLQALLVGQSLVMVVIIEAALLTAALWLLLGLIGDESPALGAATAAAFHYMLNGIVLGGMEVSLLVLCFMVLVHVLARGQGRWRGVLIGLAAAAAIGARIDAAFFVVPLLAVHAAPLRERAETFGVLAVLGAIYAGFNFWLVGTPLPISGLVKSIGGLQVNQQLISNVPELSRALMRLVVPAAVCIPALMMTRRGSLAWSLALAYPVGLALYGAKLFLGSSWTVWSWYFFPAAIGLVAVVLAFAPVIAARLEAGGPLIGLGAIAAAVLLAISILVPAARTAMDPRNYTAFRQIYALAFDKLGPVLAGQRVAIGDRAGALGWMYPGPVTHIEGLVGDKLYFDTVAAGGDTRALLCRRGVRFIMDWEVDLGDYRTHDIRTFKEGLTTHSGPLIRVERRSEVGRISDLSIYDMTRRGPDGRIEWSGNHFLYVWRLECP